ncbi:MAG: hypothetical protein GEU94_18530 [Micromonosporaceae bacterium]|nr:hypothetical protein [Micromonosporaceae bacterium]
MRRPGRARMRRHAAPILTVLSLTVTLTGCAEELQHKHRNVVNAESFLRQADHHFVSEMKRKPVNLAEHARCYFAVADSDEQIQDAVYCGAARAYGGRAGQVWWKVDFTPKQRGDEVRLTRPVLNTEKPARRPEGVELIRPSGASPDPRVDRIPAPEARPGKPGAMVADADGADFDAARRPRAKGVLLGPTYQIKIRHAGRAAAVSRPDGGMAAAPGETLFATDLTLGDGVEPPDQDVASGDRSRDTTYALVSGDRRRDVTEALTGRKRAVLAVSAPKRSEPRLEVTVDGTTQALSLKTGERTSPKAAAYYRSDPTTEIGKKYRERASRGDFRFVYSVRYEVATLTPYSAELGWAPAGRAWLMIGYRDAKLRDERSRQFRSAHQTSGAYALKAAKPTPSPSAKPTRSPSAEPSGSPSAEPSGSPNASPSGGPAGAGPPQFRRVLGSGEGVIVFEVPDDFADGEFAASPAFSFTSSEASPASGVVTLPTKRHAFRIAE